MIFPASLSRGRGREISSFLVKSETCNRKVCADVANFEFRLEIQKIGGEIFPVWFKNRSVCGITKEIHAAILTFSRSAPEKLGMFDCFWKIPSKLLQKSRTSKPQVMQPNLTSKK
jgi:hypothetical protein